MKDKVILSKRLEAVACMVTPGNRVCDVGCDHGFVPIYLIQQGISKRVLAMDVKKGPLERAKEHVRAYHLDNYIETRLSDGLTDYRPGEADSLICAGMGGKLMVKILETDRVKTASFRELILQPQSELEQFRRFLRTQGYLLTAENMIEEDGKFYPIMKAVKGLEKTLTLEESSKLPWQIKMEDRYGPVLLQSKHPVLYRYLEREARILKEILKQIEANKAEGEKQNDRCQEAGVKKRTDRYTEVREQLRDCLQVMQMLCP